MTVADDIFVALMAWGIVGSTVVNVMLAKALRGQGWRGYRVFFVSGARVPEVNTPEMRAAKRAGSCSAA